MHGELNSEFPNLPITIVGINEVGHESGNSLMTAGRTSPLLQDVDANDNGESDVWYDDWQVVYRDVKIVNAENELVGTVNLTPPAGFDLGVDENYNALKQILSDVAHDQPFWQNPNDPVDVTNDNIISPKDALQCINELNERRISDSTSTLPLPMPPHLPTPYLDVNGDGRMTPNDALIVINRLIANSSNQAQGESIKEPATALLLIDSAPQGQPMESDEPTEQGLENPQIEPDSSSLPTVGETAAAGGVAFSPDASALSGEAVDDVFQSDVDMLAESVSGCLLEHDQPVGI